MRSGQQCLWYTVISLLLPRDAMQARPTSSCGVCLCVCPSVAFVNSVKTNKHINKFFTPSGSQAILDFPYQTAWRYSDWNPLNRDVKCRWDRQKSRFWTYIWLYCVMLTLLPARCYQYGATRPRSRKLWHIAGSKRRSSLIARNDDEMFMTRSLNVTQKTTEQHLIVHSDKSVAYVTNSKRLHSPF